MSRYEGLPLAERSIPPDQALPEADLAALAAERPPGGLRVLARRVLLAAAGLAALAAAGIYGEDYWRNGRFLVSTDDAYIQADNITIAPKVAGYLAEVLVGDNERVRAGQVLARIDDRDFQVALDQARADVAAAQATIASRQAALETQKAAVEAAKSTVAVGQANQVFAEQEDKRYADLAARGYGSVQNAQQAAPRIAASRAAVQRDLAALTSATKQIGQIEAEISQGRRPWPAPRPSSTKRSSTSPTRP